MKIVCWNLKNIGHSKLAKTYSPVLAAAGLGGNVLDYMMKVVMADPTWQHVTTAAPADVFVIIELKSGGSTKGAAATGTSAPTLAAITAAMNTLAPAPVNGVAAYHYASVPALVTGHHECVGIIYNDQVLTYTTASVLRNSLTGDYLSGRTPFLAEFTVNGTATTLRLVGVHAPPPKGADSVRFKAPIKYASDLADITVINQAQPNLCLLGDFNCSPASSYQKGAGAKKMKVLAFNELIAGATPYLTKLPDNTLTSCRKNVVAANTAPGNYLKDAYDNIFYKLTTAPAGLTSTQLDTIGQALALNPTTNQPLYPTSVRMLLSNYWKVSDHIPLVINY